jgi:uncharacterized protein YjbI with pentapeptide repeats
MQNSVDKLYNEYLNKKLDSLFDIKVPEEEEEAPSIYEIMREYNQKDESPERIKGTNGKYYIVDNSGNKISDEYDYISPFRDGYARVQIGDEDAYITKQGNLWGEWHDFVSDFREGLASICDKKLYNIIDTNGNYILPKPRRYFAINDFHEGIAKVNVRSVSDIIYIDRTGKPINKERYEKGENFYCGYAYVEREGLCNYIDQNGKDKYPRWFKLIESDLYGYHLVKDGNKYNILDIKGDFISARGFDKADALWDYLYHVERDGLSNIYAPAHKKYLCNAWYKLVKVDDEFITVMDRNNKWGLINKKTGELINGKMYDSVSVRGTYCVVSQDGKYNAMDKNGIFISDKWYPKMENSPGNNRFLVTRENGQQNFIDEKGNEVCKEWYDYIRDVYVTGFSLVQKKRFGVSNFTSRWNCIDMNGNVVFDDWFFKPPSFRSDGYVFDTLIEDNDAPLTVFKIGKNKKKLSKQPRYYGNYKIKKKGSIYECTSSDGYKFNIKYKPIHIYGNNYVVCTDNNKIYLYEVDKEKYNQLTNYDELYMTNFTDYFIFYNDKVFLMYDNLMVDITEYYNDKLKGKEFVVKEGISIATKEVFSNNKGVREVCLKEIQKDEEEQKRLKEQEEQKRIEEIKAEQIKQEQELKNMRDSSIERLHQEIERLNDCEKRIKNVRAKRFEIANILIDCGDHKEINPLCFVLELRRVDLSKLPLKNVKISGLDFSGTNILFNRNDPQEVYNKDLRDCDFTGINFLPGTIFDGVHIEGAKFTIDNVDRTMDINIESFKNAYYDENTTLNGVPLVELLNKEKTRGK